MFFIQNGRNIPGPLTVGSFSPAGDSEFGVSDMVGNVWQYTDEFRDAHTRAVLVKGSANYRPSGSEWYFPNALELNKHNKYGCAPSTHHSTHTTHRRHHQPHSMSALPLLCPPKYVAFAPIPFLFFLSFKFVWRSDRFTALMFVLVRV